MCVVCSYPEELISGYRTTQDEIISALENELRQYAREIGNKVEGDLKRIAQGLKPVRNKPVDEYVWGLVMKNEDDLFQLANSKKLVNNDDYCFEGISDEDKIQMTDNYSLLDKIKSTCIDEELFDVRRSIEDKNLLFYLNEDNLELFCKLVLRRNIIHREMYPKILGDKYKEWLNPSENKDTESISGKDDPSGNETQQVESFPPGLKEELMPIFFSEEDKVNEFLTKIKGMKDRDITDLVNDWVKRKLISDYGNSRKGDLWSILKKYSLYSKTKQNWCKRVK